MNKSDCDKVENFVNFFFGKKVFFFPFLQQKHIDIVLRPAQRFKQIAKYNDDLKKFAEGL